ncbi:MAG: virulence factor [Gammaproteobacteria bacterium]|nr:virulence factor [Gammaproteobacteria bacterium]MDH3751963.1 virulence factor [Gammaproteobacteria bacterium]MDH3804522.1 virulence factor [Gammaproteobacteria bacterium]
MVKKILIYWRDIPAQVIVQRGREREKAQLSLRFQEAIDRAAMRAGKGSSDAYLSEWRREASTIESAAELRQIVEQEISRFEAEFSDDVLLRLIRNHGSAGEQ